jgi:ATP-binding cassette subfamily C protein
MTRITKSKSRFQEIITLSVDGFQLLSASGKRTIVLYTISLSVIGLLDALGLGLLAHALSSAAKSPLEMEQGFVHLLLVVIFLFISRSLLAVWISYLGLNSMAREEVFIGQLAFENLSKRSWLHVRKLSLSDIQLLVDRSSNALVQNFLFLNATIISEAINALIIVALLIVVSPITAAVTGIYFSLISIAQHFALSKRSSRSGVIVAEEFGKVYSLLDDFFQFGKILRVTHSSSMQKSLVSSRELLAKSRATAAFLSSIPRYFMEAVLALGCLLIFVAAYIEGGSTAVIPALAIFAGAGFRLLPIVNKIQGLVLVLFTSYPLAKSSFQVKEDSASDDVDVTDPLGLEVGTLLQLKKVSFKFPDSDIPTLTDIDLKIDSGKQYAIVGDSGSGKTTLTEIIVGLLLPTSGQRITAATLPIRFGYVPQDTPIMLGTIKQNIAMSWNSLDIDDDLILEVIKKAQLQSFVEEFEKRNLNLDSKKLLLSGGQRQRLGIARALYNKSNLLILDEPTSSLDTGLESQLVEMLTSLKPDVATITVAHRLTTIQTADVIFYLENGSIIASGNFSELSQSSEGFKKMIELSSLSNGEILGE